jgi:uncharacterized protein
MRFRMTGLSVVVLTLWISGCVNNDAGKTDTLLVAERFNLADISLLDGPFLDARELGRTYLMSLDPDRLLHMFRITAGIPSESESYGGWEQSDIEVRGHTMGHYLSALAKMYAATGDEKILERGNYVVEALASCQAAAESAGYCMAFPELFFDRLERGEPVWAPYYTFHKLLAGMIDQHVYTGSTAALKVAESLALWVRGRTDKLDSVQMQSMLENEHGGMVEALAELYHLTGNREYLLLANRFEHTAITVPLSLNEDALLGKHANTQIPKIIGAAREYEATGDDFYKRIALNGWASIAGVRTYVFGGLSNYEFFLRPPNILSDQLSVETAETCCTHNMLKLADRLITWSADPLYGDYYERALVNHILASQDPETGMVMYYMPQKPGHWKIWSTPDSSFWCCVGSGMENPAEYGRSIYYHAGDDLYINLFIASRLSWEEQGMVLTQTTRFPDEERSVIEVSLDKPSELNIHIRVPWWVGDRFRVTVNGDPVQARALPSSWLEIERKWRDGDRIEVAFPFALHTERMPDDPSLVAIMNGPVVLAADLGTLGLTDENRYLKNQRGMHKYNAPEIPIPVLRPGSKEITDWLTQHPGGLSWFSAGNLSDPTGIVLKPYYKLTDERYLIYFRQSDYKPIGKPWNLD